MIAAHGVERIPPGEPAPDLWALAPERLMFRGAAFARADQPALVVRSPDAALWLGLEGEDLVVLGPYGDVRSFAALVAEAQAIARATGRARLVASVRNDEIERFDSLQRLGFELIEARLGALALGGDSVRAEGLMWGDIAARDELVLAAALERS